MERKQVGLEIILDTETTGLDPEKGHRLVEIGCVELANYIPTGRTFQTYLNPQRDMPPGAFAVHGLSESFLKQFQIFPEIAPAFLEFIGDKPLVIHNASFDMKFLQAELGKARLPLLSNPVVDTLEMARRKFPGARASLDMLCRRFDINNSHREKHGALLDAHILAQVYLELCGGLQPHLSLHQDKGPSIFQEGQGVRSLAGADPHGTGEKTVSGSLLPLRRLFLPSAEELEAHRQMIASLGGVAWAEASQ